MDTFFYDNGPTFISGVNARLLHWAETSPLAKKAFRVGGGSHSLPAGVNLYTNEKDLVSDLAEMFTATDGWQIVKADEFTLKLWRTYPELGPYPCQGLLSDYQWDGMFYSGYRDHVFHQVNVMLIGLYIYENCSPIRAAIQNEIEADLDNVDDKIDREDEFIRRWIAASLAHDVGYVLENEKLAPSVCAQNGDDGSETHWHDFLNTLNGYLQSPLAYTLSEPSIIEHASQNEQVLAAAHKLTQFPRCVSTKQLLRQEAEAGTQRSTILKKLNVYADKASLSMSGGNNDYILETYYDETQQAHQANRRPYKDHGIVSTLLLVNGWQNYFERVHEIAKRREVCRAFEHSNGFGNTGFVRLSKRLQWHTIKAAAGAISLHNINAERRYIPDYAHGGLNSLARIGFMDDRGCPLAFLLALSDTLQNWGRPRFGKTIKKGPGLKASEFHLDCRNDKLFIGFNSDNRANFDRLFEGLKVILKETEYKNLLEIEEDFKPNSQMVDYMKKAYEEMTSTVVTGNAVRTQPQVATPANDTSSDRPTIPPEINFKIKDLTGVDPVASQMDVCANPRVFSAAQRPYCDHQWQSLHLTSELRRTIEAVGEIAQLYQKLTVLFQEIEHIITILTRSRNSSRTIWEELIDYDWYNLDSIIKNLNKFMGAGLRRQTDERELKSGQERLFAVLLTKVWSDEKGIQYDDFKEGYGNLPSVVSFFYQIKLGGRLRNEINDDEQRKLIDTIQNLRRPSTNILTQLRRRIEEHYRSSISIKKVFTQACIAAPAEWPSIYAENYIEQYLSHLQVRDTRVWRSN